MWETFRIPFCLSTPIHAELDNYSNTGKKYKDWIKTGLNWIKKRQESKDQRDIYWIQNNFKDPIKCVINDHGHLGYFQYKFKKWSAITGSKDRNKFFDSIRDAIDDWKLTQYMDENRDLMEL
jgi:hypothetical protein